MLKNRDSLVLWVVAVLLVVAGNVHAHRKPECLTTLQWFAADSRLEITHRLHRHDAQRALAQRLKRPELSLETVAARARFALDLEAQFALRGEGPLRLQLIGAELEGDYLLVYQEYQGALPRQFSVRSDVLRDVFAELHNRVLVVVGDSRQQLSFLEPGQWQAVSLPTVP